MAASLSIAAPVSRPLFNLSINSLGRLNFDNEKSMGYCPGSVVLQASNVGDRDRLYDLLKDKLSPNIHIIKKECVLKLQVRVPTGFLVKKTEDIEFLAVVLFSRLRDWQGGGGFDLPAGRKLQTLVPLYPMTVSVDARYEMLKLKVSSLESLLAKEIAMLKERQKHSAQEEKASCLEDHSFKKLEDSRIKIQEELQYQKQELEEVTLAFQKGLRTLYAWRELDKQKDISPAVSPQVVVQNPSS